MQSGSLKEQARFNDPNESSVLNANSLDEYRQWQFRTKRGRGSYSNTARSKSADSSVRSRARRSTFQMSPAETQSLSSTSARNILLPVRRNISDADNSSDHIFLPSLVTPKFHSERRVR